MSDDKKTGRDRGDGPTRKDLLQRIAEDYSGNSVEAQRGRIFDALTKIGPLTTVEARRFLDVMHPAQRVLELRTMGADIKTLWSLEPTECGKLHRVAKYVLLPKAAFGGRYVGAIHPGLIALLILATVAGLLLVGVV